MKKQLLIYVSILGFAAAALVFFSYQRKAQDSPNIIFIIFDAARADHFSCYGYKKNTTPRMDGISRKGALFLNNFSQATSTIESLPKIFFSRYFSLPIFPRLGGQLWGITPETPWSVFRKFDDQQIFLTDILSLNGYKTAFFHNCGRFFEGAYLVRKFGESYFFNGREEVASDKAIISAASSWIDRNKGRRFFIYCHIMSPHEPYPPKEEDDEFLPGEDPVSIEAVREKNRTRKNNLAWGWSRDDLEILRGLYDSNLKHSDKWIGVLFDNLEKLGLEDKTLVIITADHGENLGERNFLAHGGTPWDSVTHVPLIMVYPPLIPAGVRVSGLTESIDIMPTVLETCGIKIPKSKSMDGLSLLEFIKNPQIGKESVFTHASIRTEKYKYIVGKDLLYNLEEYPGEAKNIANKEPLIKERLKTKFERAMSPYRDRYENSKREDAPDFPFYFPIDCFKATPEDAFEECEVGGDRERIAVLEEVSPKKSWLLNRHWRRVGLFCLPANGPPPPLTLSAPLPNGSYRASILLESPDKISLFPEKLGFRFRFDTRNSFGLPGGVDFVREHRKAFCCYLDLGETELTKEKFSIQISFHPPGRSPYGIRHIRFDPAGSQRKEAAKAPDKEDLRRRMESLKSLGYL